MKKLFVVKLIMSMITAGCSAPLTQWQPAGEHPGSASASVAPYSPPANILTNEVMIDSPASEADSHQLHQTHARHSAPAQIGMTADYPLQVCLVSGEKLGSMGKPVLVEHAGRKAWLCCQGCVEKFQASPDTFMKQLNAATTNKSGRPGQDRQHEGPGHEEE